MKRVYEFSTWRTEGAYKALNHEAIEAGKKYAGKKFTVAVGQWGTISYLVFADTKEEAKTIALTEYHETGRRAENDSKVTVRDVTNSKKYN